MDWLSDKWEAIVGAIGLAGVWWRNETKTNRVHDAVFDKHGSVRFPTFAICAQCQRACQESLNKDLREIKDDIKDMQTDIKELLKIIPR